MGGRRRPKIEQPSADSPPKDSSSGSSGLSEEHVAPRKIPSSSSNPYGEEEVISAPERKRPDPRTLRLILLNLIRSFYLEALSRLPASRLWSKHVRGVFVAGHGYGPLSPVDNILVNAIWYDAAFPRCPTSEFHFGDVLEITHQCMSRMMQPFWLAYPPMFLQASYIGWLYLHEPVTSFYNYLCYMKHSIYLYHLGGCGACTRQYIKMNHPIDKEHHGGLDSHDAEIGNGDDHWDYNFSQLVDFLTFDAERDCATVWDLEKQFPRRSDGDESVESIWIVEM